MATFEIKPEYKREEVKVELAESARATFQLLKHSLSQASDNFETEDSLKTYLGNFIKNYNSSHKKNEELNPDDLVVTTFSYDEGDLQNFKVSVEGLSGLLEEVKEKIDPVSYAEYAKSLKVILIETDFNLSRLDGDGDGERKAA